MREDMLWRVLECCSFRWQRHKDIASEYDRRFPPEWHNFLRRLYLHLGAGPTVLLYSELGKLEEAGLVEIKIQREIVIDAMSGQPHKLDLARYRRKSKGGGKGITPREENTELALFPA
jgi:hypothetical protein